MPSSKALHKLLERIQKGAAVCTDTRKIQKGDIFFALKGPSFNGNFFAEKALDLGAKKIIIDDPSFDHLPNSILVEDTLLFLQRLAKVYRKTLKTKVICIAGSNGKTTTKEILGKVLSECYNTFITPGNLNNHIGLPLSILKIPQDTEFAILELGANALGETEFLSAIAMPNYGVVTNNGKDHLEGYGSIEKVIEANTELYAFLKEHSGTVFIDPKDEILKDKAQNIRSIDYIPLKETVSKNGLFLKFEYESLSVESQLVGSYNLQNIRCAITIAKHFNIPPKKIKRAIESYAPTNNRSSYQNKQGIKFILDCYNANPSSMHLALKNFIALSVSKKILVLSQMNELGKHTEKEHGDVLKYIAKHNWYKVYLIGNAFKKHQSQYKTFNFFESTNAFLDQLKKDDFKNAIVLLKGSRSYALEKVYQAF